jgi:hypothetical protein
LEGITTLENQLGLSTIFKYFHTFDPAASPLNIHPTGMLTCFHQKMQPSMFQATLFVIDKEFKTGW